mgnify:CR=1 FL=1
MGEPLQFSCMKFDDLYWTFCSWGFALKPEYYQRFKVYFEDMLVRRRVIGFQNEDGLMAVLTYFITRDHHTLANKPEFATPQDDELGTEIYIDKMVCKKWNLSLRRAMQDMIETTFPNVQMGFWHRQPDNRCVVTYKRGTKYAGKNTK